MHTIIPQKLWIYYLLCWWNKVRSLKYIMLNYKDGLKSNPKSFRSREICLAGRSRSQRYSKLRKLDSWLLVWRWKEWGEEKCQVGLGSWEGLLCWWLIRQHLTPTATRTWVLPVPEWAWCYSSLEPPERNTSLQAPWFPPCEMLRWESAESHSKFR